MKLFIFLSEILDQKVTDVLGREVGRLYDIPLRMSEEIYPRASGLVLRRGRLKFEYAHVNMEDVGGEGNVFQLKIPADKVVFEASPRGYDLTLRQDILDHQVVDTDNQKVVRVNDVHLLRVDHHLYLAHVDIGVRALVRRLGWTPVVDAFVRGVAPRSSYLTREDFIPWKSTQVLTSGRYKNVLRLSVSRKKMASIPPIELAEIMEDLDIFEKMALFKSLEVGVQRKVFADLATQEKLDLLEQLEDEEAADLLENIPADEATDVLMALPKDAALKLMRRMENETSRQLRKLLGFAKDSAGGLMTTEYLTLKPEATVQDALDLVKSNINYPGNIYHVYIVDENHKLLGMTSLRRFLAEAPDENIMKTCYPKKIFVRTDDGMEEIALLLEKYKFTSIPVLNEGDILQGVITTDDVMEELIALAWKKYKEKLV